MINILLTDNVTNKVSDIEPKDLAMDMLFTPTLVFVLSSVVFLIVTGTFLSILLSQRLHKRHRGYNPTDNQVRSLTPFHSP